MAEVKKIYETNLSLKAFTGWRLVTKLLKVKRLKNEKADEIRRLGLLFKALAVLRANCAKSK